MIAIVIMIGTKYECNPQSYLVVIVTLIAIIYGLFDKIIAIMCGPTQNKNSRKYRDGPNTVAIIIIGLAHL